jgi:4-hydroxy-3-polyprenylbenzoate decarboxylase
MNSQIVVAITGASGTAYAVRLAQVLQRAGLDLHLVVSDAARQVAQREIRTDFPPASASADQWNRFLHTAFDNLPEWQLSTPQPGSAAGDESTAGNIHVHSLKDYGAGIASGSFLTGGMVICPCSMGTLSSIATGASTNLIQRAADVHLKERRPLVIVPRETPLGLIQLENMVRLTQAGATVMPAMPGFYQHPTSIGDLIDFMVARICDHLSVPHELIPRWGQEQAE